MSSIAFWQLWNYRRFPELQDLLIRETPKGKEGMENDARDGDKREKWSKEDDWLY